MTISVKDKDLSQFKLQIKRDNGRYAVVSSASGFEAERFFPDQDEITRIMKRSRLIDSLLINPTAHRFTTEFIEIGSEIYGLFLRPFSKLEEFINYSISQNSAILINIQTNDHDISRLPWELLYSPEYQFIATSPRFQIIRTIEDSGAHSRELSAGPLRILFMACSPDGTEPLLNYEKEEEIILNAVADLKRKKELEIDIAEGGTLEELKEMLAKKAYHVVHLSGHGYYDEQQNTGYLSMENESGTEKKVSAKELADTLIGYASIRLLFLSACQSGREEAPNTGFACSLISNGIPMVIGMKQAVSDYAASFMEESFYRHLTLKRSVSHAFQLSREEFAKKHSGNFQWAIPAIFSRVEDTSIVDWTKPLIPIKERETSIILYGGVEHLKEGFRGRRRELREYLKILRGGPPSTICITGAGGVGKSTLASRLTDRLHKSGYMVIPLKGEITPDRFIQETINTLVAEKEWEHLEILKRLVDYNEKIIYIISNILGTRETIYLLDNFEDNLKQSARFREFKNPFWEASFKTILEQLPHTCSRMLITCRYTIPRIPENLLFQRPLKEMSEGEARKLMIFNKDYAGIDLKQIREVYQAIGGNPKAIKELGRLLYKGDITWESLKEKLGKVTKEMREFTIFEQLYNFLSREEQGFFRRVSVYRGPVGLDGIKVQEPDDSKAKDYIKRLVDYSLLQQYEDNIYAREYYQVHLLNRENIRQEWWQEGEKEKAHQNAAGYYLRFEDKRFRIESLSNAVYQLRSGKMYNQMAELITKYANQLILKGFWDEGIYLHQSILEEKGSVEKRFSGIAYNNIGGIYDSKGEWDKALEYYLKAEEILIEVGDTAGLGSTYNNIGLIYSKKGDWDRALQYYLEAEKISIEVGDRAGLAPTYNNIGRIYDNKGDWDKALQYYHKVEKISIEVGDRAGLATTYNNIGLIYHNKGEQDRALEYYLKAEKILIEVEDRVGLARTYNNIGSIYSEKGERDKALEKFLEVEKISIEVGDRAGLATTYNNIGLIYYNKGVWDRALQYYLKAEKILIEVGDRAGLAVTYFNTGASYLNKNNKEKGDSYIVLAGYIAITLGMKHELSQMRCALEPIIKEIGEEGFMEIGKRLYESKKL